MAHNLMLMTLHRFFVLPGTIRTSHVELNGSVYEQIYRVLRMRPGDHIALFDGSGYEYLATLGQFGKGSVRVEIEERRQPGTEPRHSVGLYLSLLNKTEKFEWALQKCTELGVSHFVPVIAARSVTQHARRDRWERIILEAAEQSGRLMLPTLSEPLTLPAALAQISLPPPSGQRTGFAFMPEVGSAISLKVAMDGIAPQKVERVALFIGPEGGFTLAEQEAARAAGARLVALGSRVLRAETAAVVAATVALLELAEL